jgi:hypothetical protein
MFVLLRVEQNDEIGIGIAVAVGEWGWRVVGGEYVAVTGEGQKL